MSLYREAGAGRLRRVIAVALVALLVGLGSGFALGRSSAPEPSIAEQLTELQARVQPVLDGLDLVPDHYLQGVRGGEVVGEVQYSGTQAQAASARDSLESVAPDLEQVDPEGLAEARASIDELIAAIDAREDAPVIDELVAQASATVSSAAGIGSSG